MTPYFSKGYYAGVRGDHCPRLTSSMIPDGVALDEARRECVRGFNFYWAETFPTMTRLHGPAEEVTA